MNPFQSLIGDPQVMRQRAGVEVQRRFQALGREAAADPFSIVAHVIGGCIVGSAVWALSHVVDYDEISALDLAKDPPAYFSFAPEVTTSFLEFQGFVNRAAMDQVAWFREAIREADALFALECSVLDGQVDATPACVTDCNGHVSRVLSALRNIRDEQITDTKFQTLNSKIAELTGLLYTHVTNVRTSSMAAGPRIHNNNNNNNNTI